MKMSLRNLSIGRQIGLGFLVVLLFLMILGVGSTLSQQEANRSMQSIYADRVVPLRMVFKTGAAKPAERMNFGT
jgi:methyl-accepting chemotaxis protein-1 (serine sensor receptor)